MKNQTQNITSVHTCGGGWFFFTFLFLILKNRRKFCWRLLRNLASSSPLGCFVKYSQPFFPIIPVLPPDFELWSGPYNLSMFSCADTLTQAFIPVFEMTSSVYESYFQIFLRAYFECIPSSLSKELLFWVPQNFSLYRYSFYYWVLLLLFLVCLIFFASLLGFLMLDPCIFASHIGAK